MGTRLACETQYRKSFRVILLTFISVSLWKWSSVRLGHTTRQQLSDIINFTGYPIIHQGRSNTFLLAQLSSRAAEIRALKVKVTHPDVVGVIYQQCSQSRWVQMIEIFSQFKGWVKLKNILLRPFYAYVNPRCNCYSAQYSTTYTTKLTKRYFATMFI